MTGLIIYNSILTFSSNTNTSQSSVSQHSFKHSTRLPKSISFKYLAPIFWESWVLIILSLCTLKLSMQVWRSISGLLFLKRGFDGKSMGGTNSDRLLAWKTFCVGCCAAAKVAGIHSSNVTVAFVMVPDILKHRWI